MSTYKFMAKIGVLLWCLFSSMAASSQTAQLNTYTFSDGSTFRAISDNGKWAIAHGVNSASSQDAYPKLINLETKEVIDLTNNGEDAPVSNALDVTDDGNNVVGSYLGSPAVWNRQTKTWKVLDLQKGCDNGSVTAITPDGKYAVGKCGHSTKWLFEVPTMWDVTTGKVIELPNMPEVDLSGEYQDMTRLDGLSADGRYIVGCVSYSYPQYIVYFLYDRETESFDPLVFDYDKATKKYTPKHSDVYGLDGICISPNGKWVAGELYTMEDERAPFRYNTETKEMEYYLEPEDIDKGCVSVDNNGTIYAATPAINPSRSLYIRHNDYWYGIDELLSQRYGINYYTYTGYDATGLTIGISADCKTLVAIAYISEENYSLSLNETFGEACEKVNLLKSYTISPMNEATMTNLSNITLTFSRNIEVVGDKADIVLKDAAGNTVRSALRFAANTSNSKIVNIGFRTTTLDEGKEYTVVIPAGTICLAGDKSRVNDEIIIKYVGYGEKNLTLVSVSPENGSDMSQFDLTTSPVVMTFDTEVAVTADAKGYLYRQGEDEPIAELSVLSGKTSETFKQVLLYPITTQLLYKYSKYTVVLPAGMVTDLSGMSKNSECRVEYVGVYERIIDSDDVHLFSENFAYGMDNVMLFDGDGNKPIKAMEEMNFTNDCAWQYAADDDYSNTCAMSHSMYMPSGKSDDWMVTPQLYIPDDKCYLSFKAQSYLSRCSDSLKVVIYATDMVYNSLDETIIGRFKNEGVVLDKVGLTCGEYENTLDGDWQSFNYSLADYVGKNIYIAFVNENSNRSAVFLTDIAVERVSDVSISLAGIEPTVLNATSQDVKGKVVIVNENNTYTDIKLQLIDSQMNIIEELSATGLSLKKDDTYEFAFSKPVALTQGRINTFMVRALLNGDDVDYTMDVTIKNLAFTTNRRVVVEEETGQDCSNCPLGHLAMEKLEGIYGENIIPLCYHIYTGDPLESGMTPYGQDFLGMYAAPTAVINRLPQVSSPMGRSVTDGVIDYYFTNGDGTMWLDLVGKCMETLTEADIEISATYYTHNDMLNIPFNVRFAIDNDNANYGLLCVVTEDGLTGFQRNNLYSVNDDDLGEWQYGGSMGKSVIFPYTFDNVARALYPAQNYFGQTGLLPRQLKHSQDYQGQVSFKVSESARYVDKIENCHVTMMLINTLTGEMVNAARAKVTITTDIDAVEADSKTNAEGEAYDLGGRRTDSKGIVVVKGEKKVVK